MPLFASSIFDSPWIIVAIVLISIVSNWLSKRRQATEAKQLERENRQPSAAPAKPAEEFDLEETLRRLMGEEPPPKAPAPPPLPPPIRREMPPPLPRSSAPPLRLPALPVAEPVPAAWVDTEDERDAAIRIAQLAEQARHAAATRRRRSPATTTRWRNPRTARQAFIASLVFSQPKGLEP